MHFRNKSKRIFLFAKKRWREFFTLEFWKTVARVYKSRFNYFSRISNLEFIHNLQQIEKRPWNLHIEVTNICNANCLFCAYRFQTRNKMIMSKKVYSKALDDYCYLGGGELRLETCVGDPLVDPDFIERIKEARLHPEITEIFTLTNGINLDKTGIENILQSGINEIRISTGPWDNGLYKLIYRSEDYQRVRRNVTELLERNAETGERVRIRLLFRSNLSMKKTLELPDYQAIRHLPHEIEFNTDFDTWLGKIGQKDLIGGMHIRPLSELEKEPCCWLYDGPIIFVDGKVGLCGCRDFNADSELIIGNILENSLLELWQSEQARILRQRFWNGHFPDICKRCASYANLDFYRTRDTCSRIKLITKWLGAKREEYANIRN